MIQISIYQESQQKQQTVYKQLILGYDGKIMVVPENLIPDTFLCMKPTSFTVLALLATVGGYT